MAIASCFLHAPGNVVFSSLKQLFIVFRAAEEIMKVPAGDLADKRVKLASVLKKDKTQYLVLLTILYPGVIEFSHWITESLHASNLFTVERVGQMPDDLKIAVKKFLRTFQIREMPLFARDAVSASRVDCALDMLVDPFSIDTTFVGSTERVVPCKGISLYKEPVIGASQLVSREAFCARFHDFTCGLFKGDFPWRNTYVAGGAMKIATIEGNLMPSSDVDIFVVGENFDERRSAYGRVLSWFEDRLKDVTFCTIGSVTVISSPQAPRIFQVINSGKATVTQILADFDTTSSAWACFGDDLTCLCLPEAITALRTRVVSFLRNSNNQEARCAKALMYGYNLSITSLSENSVTIEEVMDAVELAKQEADVTVWRPTKEATTEAMIERYKTGITTDTAMNTIAIVADDNFGRGYTSVSFTTLDVDSVDVKGWSYTPKPCRTTSNKLIKLSVEGVQVVRFKDDAFTFVMPAATAAEWEKFITAIGDGFSSIRHRGVNLKEFEINDSTRIFSESMATKNRRDIKPGVVCTVTFKIMKSTRSVNLLATSIVITKCAESESRSSSDEDTPF
jgi:hypothetical protein